MKNIWLISDTHFNHNKNFIFQNRGFSTIEEMNETIISRWNSIVKPDDIVYHLGDVSLGDAAAGAALVRRLNGRIRLAIGNHDTDKKINSYKLLPNIEDIQFGYRMEQKGRTLLLTHYPQLTGNFDQDKTYSIHGHTHSSEFFSEEYDLMFNVSCEATSCTPLNLETMMYLIQNHLQDKNN